MDPFQLIALIIIEEYVKVEKENGKSKIFQNKSDMAPSKT